MTRFWLSIFICFFLICACASKKIDQLFVQADEASGMRNYEKAASLYKGIISAYPTHYKTQKAHLALGAIYQYNLDNVPGSEEEYRAVIDKWPLSTAAQTAFEDLIVLHEGNGHYDMALENVYAMLKIFPKRIDERKYRHMAGDLHFKMGNFEQARVEYRLALGGDSSPRDEIYQESFFDIAESYYMEKRLDTALTLYRSFVMQYPNNKFTPLAMAHLSDCYEESGELVMAIDIQKMIKNRYPEVKTTASKIKQLEARRAKMTSSPLKEKMKWQTQ